MPLFSCSVESCLQLLLDLGALTHAATQIIQLGPANLTIANHLNVVDGRRVDGEHLLHANAIGNTADSDGLLDAAMLLGNDGTLKHLNTLAGTEKDQPQHRKEHLSGD